MLRIPDLPFDWSRPNHHSDAVLEAEKVAGLLDSWVISVVSGCKAMKFLRLLFDKSVINY